MKILLDPIHTNNPQRCSMNYKMQELMKELIEWREDVFFYYLLPSDINNDGWEVDYDWLLKSPRIKYIEIPTHKHRMLQYKTFNLELQNVCAFYGDCWDWDLLISARSQMIPMMRTLGAKTTSDSRMRSVICVEDMPVMKFKQYVNTPLQDINSLQTLSGYLASDVTLFFSFWERKEAIKEARDYLCPALIKRLSDTSYDCCPVKTKVEDFSEKSREYVLGLVRGGTQFTIGYTQRHEAGHRKCNVVFNVMENQWIFNAKDKVTLISTNGTGGPSVAYPTEIERYRSERSEYMALLKDRISVAIVMSTEDAYPLSMLEPIVWGVPVAILDRPYARATLGDKYPFYVSDETGAYAVCKMFFDDYPSNYKKFLEWRKTELLPLLLSRNEASFFKYVVEQIAILEKRQLETNEGASLGEVTKIIIDNYREGEGMSALTERLVNEGKVDRLDYSWKKRNTRAAGKLNWELDWNYYRILLKRVRGLKDSSVEAGVLS